ncbi:MAG: selenocysteine-specific translation elongation factor [Candidatus Heimdallarchaeota archaeon]|nr:selenocysteine-specific translation elongation factor [Candidatus Heimdallarchaeota archaeon]
MNNNLSNLIPTIIGTAGHIDHGKSSLVKRLTGIDPDRWDEEKKRGMTIDIGFAEMSLPSGKLIGFIDVPGHEKFIKNMVAGATGFGIVLFVVAADDGIMPQSLEHLNIMHLLGIKKGIIILSKKDLIKDPELIELLHDDIRDAVVGTFLEKAPILNFSATTGEGTSEILTMLDEEIDKLDIKDSTRVFRMPIQRVFSSVGFGSVVTGVPSDGEINVGDEIEILGIKGRTKGKIRGLQVFGQSVDFARFGHRLALNIQGVGTDKLERGDFIVASGAYRTAKIISAKIKILQNYQHKIKNTQKLTIYIGTNKIIGKIIFLSQGKFLGQGDEAFVQLRFESEMHSCVGDRLIIRDFSNQFLIGGGIVLKLSNNKPHSKKELFVQNLSNVFEKLDNPVDFIASYIEDEENSIISIKRLIEEFGFKKDYANQILNELISHEKVMKEGSNYISTAYFASLSEVLIKVLIAENTEHPFRFWHSKAHVISRMRISSDIGETIVKYLLAKGKMQSKQGKLQLTDYSLNLDKTQEKTLNLVLEKIVEGDAKPVLANEFERDLNIKHASDILEYWVYRDEIVQINQLMFVRKDIEKLLKSSAIELLSNQESFTVAEFREAVGTTRKFALPMLGYLDSIGLTRLENSERIRGRKWNELVK